MNCLDFFNKNNIQWMPINIDDEKKPIRVNHASYNNSSFNIPTFNDFKKLNDKEINDRHKAYDICNMIAFDTTKINILDVDSPKAEEIFNNIKNNYPYFLSIRKRLPHIFILLDDEYLISNKHQYKKDDIDFDLLHGQWSYISKDTIIYNDNKEIKKLDHDHNLILMKMMKTKQQNNLKKIVNDTNSKYIKLLNIFTDKDLNKEDGTANTSYKEWLNIGMALYNEDPKLINVYNEFSKRYNSYKNETEIITKWNSFSLEKDVKITIKTIYYILNKYNHNEEVNEWTNEYDNECIFWKLLESPSDYDFAKLYYSLNPNKYIHSQIEKMSNWYEYNEYNVLISYGSEAPPSLLNSIPEIIRPEIIKQRNKLVPPLKEDLTVEQFEIQTKIYDSKIKLCKKAYQDLGMMYKGKGIIAYLKKLYTIDKIYDKFDANTRIIAFNNIIFDLDIDGFRHIQPDDYITKTNKLTLNVKNIKKINELKLHIQKLLKDIFDKDEIVDYYMTITGLSLFTNKFECMYCLTGVGSNGKGLLSSILQKALGDYFGQAENTFLTQKKKDEKNPTLAKSKGKRYLLVTEPEENENNVCTLNIDFVKSITGRDMITCRDLYSSTITYMPQFTMFLQCNEKPKLNKLDNAVLRRLKVINFPNVFKMNPDPSNKFEKQADTDLKDKIDDDFSIAFLMLLFDYAMEHKNKKEIEMPTDCKNETTKYINENNIFGDWFSSNVIKQDNQDIFIKCKDLKDIFNRCVDDCDKLKSVSELIKKLTYNKITVNDKDGFKILRNYKIKEEESESSFISDNGLDN